jgi:hypothetical protein
MGGADLIDQFSDTIPLGNVYVGKTAPASNNDGDKLTISPQTLYSNLGVAASQNENMYWFITTPSPCPPGTYTFTYVINIDYQTWAT